MLYPFAEHGVTNEVIVLVVVEHRLGLKARTAHHPNCRLRVLAYD